MNWMLIILGFVALLFMGAFVVGALLPRTHTASRTTRFDQTPETIFAALSDWRAFPTWRPELREVRAPSGEERASWIEVSRHGEMPMELIESDPPRRLVGRIADPQHRLPFGGTWTYVIEPAPDGGCTLTITEAGEVRPPLFRFMSRFIFGHTATLEQYLKNLGRKFGQVVRFDQS